MKYKDKNEKSISLILKESKSHGTNAYKILYNNK